MKCVSAAFLTQALTGYICVQLFSCPTTCPGGHLPEEEISAACAIQTFVSWAPSSYTLPDKYCANQQSVISKVRYCTAAWRIWICIYHLCSLPGWRPIHHSREEQAGAPQSLYVPVCCHPSSASCHVEGERCCHTKPYSWQLHRAAGHLPSLWGSAPCGCRMSQGQCSKGPHVIHFCSCCASLSLTSLCTCRAQKWSCRVVPAVPGKVPSEASFWCHCTFSHAAALLGGFTHTQERGCGCYSIAQKWQPYIAWQHQHTGPLQQHSTMHHPPSE